MRFSILKNYTNSLLTHNDNVLFERLKYYFNFPTLCYLRYRLQLIKNQFLCSNVLMYLFNCPRSDYAISNCKYCSRLFAPCSSTVFLASLETLCRIVSSTGTFCNSVLPLFEEYFIKRFNLNIAYKSREHYETIIFEQERCLELCVFDSPYSIILKYCEVLLRILYNFLWSVSDDFKDGRKIFFLDSCLYFMIEFFGKVTRLIHTHQFQTIYLTYTPHVDYSTRHIRIINNKYIEYCRQRFDSIEEF